MFGNIKKTLATTAVVAVGAIGLPSVASAATPVPPLPAGATQAYASPDGVTRYAAAVKRVFRGSLTLTAGTPPNTFTVTCTVQANIRFNPDGTTLVQSATFSPTPCPTSVPGCTATATATNLGWGNRLISWPGASGPPSGRYDIANVSFQNVFSAGCPVPAGTPFPETGEVWFRLSPVGGGSVTSAVPTAPRNVVTGPLGTASIAGSLSLFSGGAIFTVL